MTINGLYLQWEGKRLYTQRVPTPRVLEHVPALSVVPSTGNRIIEGDNFQVLTSLRSQCVGEVDVVYLDPPYNLGKDDFRYSDKRFHDPDAEDDDATYVTNEDGGRHTKWLNFMAPRLYMLKQIMHDDRGVIFVSINDVELYRLGLLMDEIFGPDNHLGTLVWSGSTDNNPTRIATEHEYVLCYAKKKDKLPPVWSGRQNDIRDLLLAEYERIKADCEPNDVEEIQQRFRKFIRQNKESLEPLTHYTRVDKIGPYTGSRAVHNPGKDGYFYPVYHPNGKVCTPPARGYRFSESTMRQLISDDLLIYGKDEDQIIQLKSYLKDYVGSLKSVITDIDSRTGANELAELFGNRNVFRNPKPVSLLELLLDYSTTSQSLVLDPFAGSGTTGHAVLSLNQKDGGERRFILIEEGHGQDAYANTLTAERIRRAIARYGYQAGFDFYRTGQTVDAEAIVGLQRESLANLICQADATGRGKGITRVTGYRYIIGKNHRNEAICLVWNGVESREVTKDDLGGAAREVTAAGLKRPFRIYGTYCRVGDTPSWHFCQIPDELLEQMRLR